MSSSGHPKSGINVKHYETSDVIKKFEPIRRSLSEGSGDTSLTAKSLAQLTADLIKFQEVTLGKDVRISADPCKQLNGILTSAFFLMLAERLS